MTYGLISNGANSTLAISSYAATMVFRGKASQIGGVFYPADQVGEDLIVTTNFDQGTYYETYQPGVVGQYRFYERYYSYSGSLSGFVLLFSVSLTKTIGITTYRIICNNKPVVYANTSVSSIKANILSIIQNGTSSGVPIWDIKVSIGFPAGTPQSSILSSITLYCFSATHSSDSGGGYGLNVYLENSSLAFSSNTRPLQLSDYIQVTGSTTPANIAGMIYTRNFSPAPVTPTLSLSRPGFQNTDFARYETRKFVYDHIQSAPVGYKHFWVWVDYTILNAGVSTKSGPELDFGLQVIKARLVTQQYSTTFTVQPPPYQDIILSKRESFPVTIPVIDCNKYD
jgi:hypothetical protein